MRFPKFAFILSFYLVLPFFLCSFRYVNSNCYGPNISGVIVEWVGHWGAGVSNRFSWLPAARGKSSQLLETQPWLCLDFQLTAFSMAFLFQLPFPSCSQSGAHHDQLYGTPAVLLLCLSAAPGPTPMSPMGTVCWSSVGHPEHEKTMESFL